GEEGGAQLALREMAALGVRWPVLGGDALTGIEADGELAEGMRISSAYLPDRRDERNAAFVADYARAYPGLRPDHRGAGAYDAMLLLAHAVDRARGDRRGGDAPPHALRRGGRAGRAPVVHGRGKRPRHERARGDPRGRAIPRVSGCRCATVVSDDRRRRLPVRAAAGRLDRPHRRRPP